MYIHKYIPVQTLKFYIFGFDMKQLTNDNISWKYCSLYKFTASKVSYLRIDYTRILRTLHTESRLISMTKSLALNFKCTLQFKGTVSPKFFTHLGSRSATLGQSII